MTQIQPQCTPQKLMKKLQETIIGQDKYLKDLCTAVWLHSLRKNLYDQTKMFCLRPKLNMLVLGKSGTGKTSAIQALAEILDLSVVIEDASLFTGAGWKGREVTSIVKDVITSAKDPVHADYAIVVLDEIDKVFANGTDNSTFPPINNFLKLIEGTHIRHEETGKTYEMDTSNLLFICLGAFDGLDEIISRRMRKGNHIGFCSEHSTEMPENSFRCIEKQDLIDYGINPQFLGRISMITTTNDLTTQDLEQILLKSKTSPVKQFDELLTASMGVHTSITEQAAKHIAEKAYGTGTGARALMSELTEAYQPGLYRIADKGDVRELRLDYTPQKELTLRFIQGKRDTVTICRHKWPQPNLQPGEMKAVPLELDRYTLADVLSFTEAIIEKAELSGYQALSRYTYRQIKAASYLLAAAFLSIMLSDMPQNMYHVWYLLKQVDIRLKDSTTDEWDMLFEGTSMELFQKSTEFEPDTEKIIGLSVSLLKHYCSRWLAEKKERNTEV